MLAESFAGISLEYSKISEEERQQGYDEAKIASAKEIAKTANSQLLKKLKKKHKEDIK